MKIIAVFLLIAISSGTYCQSIWENVPQASQFSPTDIEFTEINNAWVTTTNGYIAHTSDNGATWELQGNYDQIGLESISMLSSLRGYASGGNHVLETTDGYTWNEILSSDFDYYYDIDFINDSVGILDLNANTILKTIDRGQTWDTIFFDQNGYFQSIQFVNENKIVVVGYSTGPNILVSNDGGLNWDTSQSIPYDLSEVYFVDDLHGYCVGLNGLLVKTVDGGLTWQTSFPISETMKTVWFSSPNNGIMAGDQGIIYKTIDGGQNWVQTESSSNHSYREIGSLDSNNVWVVSDVLSCIKSSADGGDTWSTYYAGSGWPLLDVVFSTESDGWSCGQQGTLLHTSDGGQTWTLIESPVGYTFTDIEIVDTQIVWIASSNGYFYHTSDGGNNWTLNGEQAGDLWQIDFPTNNVGYSAGSGAILKTTNGGGSWTNILPIEQTGYVFYGCSFISADTGYISSIDSIYSTIDGGNTWQNVTPTGLFTFWAMDFPAIDTGYIVGTPGLILKTVDGGANWTELSSGVDEQLAKVFFQSVDTGWVVGASGTILSTVDGGLTWLPQSTPSPVAITAVNFSGNANTNGWASKVDGNLLQYSCQNGNSLDISSFTLSSGDLCYGSVDLHASNNTPISLTVGNSNQVANPVTAFSNLCVGHYYAYAYDACGVSSTGEFVIPDSIHFFSPISFPDSLDGVELGYIQEICDFDLSSINTVKLLGVAIDNSSVISAQWQLSAPDGFSTIVEAQYSTTDTGLCHLQLSLFCEQNGFEGLVANENVYIENGLIYLGLSPHVNPEFNYWPNPTTGDLHVNFLGYTGQYYLKNAQGQLLFTSNFTDKFDLNLSERSSGTYFIELHTSGSILVKRIIKL